MSRERHNPGRLSHFTTHATSVKCRGQYPHRQLLALSNQLVGPIGTVSAGLCAFGQGHSLDTAIRARILAPKQRQDVKHNESDQKSDEQNERVHGSISFPGRLASLHHARSIRNARAPARSLRIERIGHAIVKPEDREREKW